MFGKLGAALAVPLIAAIALSGCALNPMKLFKKKSDKMPPVAEAPLPPRPPRQEDDPAFWRADGQAILAQLKQPRIAHTHARNVILFIGDGMGDATIKAAGILAGQTAPPPKGQKLPPNGEEGGLSFERFPQTARAKTYNIDLQTPDAAGAMSAILTGVKTRGSSIGLDPVPYRGQCVEAATHETPNLLEQAKAAGLATGLVTTSRVTYPAPAAAYAHLSEPEWEVDAIIPDEQANQGCVDIARQLAELRGGLDIVLGGGRLAFLPNTVNDTRDGKKRGVRRGGADLTALWEKNNNGRFLSNAAELKTVNWAVYKGPVLGLFAPDHMSYQVDGNAAEPSLTDMTTAAIKALQRGPHGYVLVVDAGGIGRAHDARNAYKALGETQELSRAVQAAMDLVNEDDTLIMVTADYSDTLTISGNVRRGNPILGTAEGIDHRTLLDKDGNPYTPLIYGSGSPLSPAPPRPGGPGWLTPEAAEAPDYRQAAGVTLRDTPRGAQDVTVYARGPGSQWVRGTLDQHVLYWIMREAVLGPVELPKKKGFLPKLPKIPKLWPFGKKKG